MGDQLPLDPIFPTGHCVQSGLNSTRPTAISSLWDSSSHASLQSISSESGRVQRSQKLQACGWAGPASLELTRGMPQMADLPGPKSGPEAPKAE